MHISPKRSGSLILLDSSTNTYVNVKTPFSPTPLRDILVPFNSERCTALSTIPETRLFNGIRSGFGVHVTKFSKRYAATLAATTVDQALQHVYGHAVGRHDNFQRLLVADAHISVSATGLGFYHEPYEKTSSVEVDR